MVVVTVIGEKRTINRNGGAFHDGALRRFNM